MALRGLADRRIGGVAGSGLPRRLVAGRWVSLFGDIGAGQSVGQVAVGIFQQSDRFVVDPSVAHGSLPAQWELGPGALEELDLPTALSNYAEEWTEHSGVPVQFQCTGPWDGRLPYQVETTLYRIVQEALTNVAKHARAGRVSLIVNRLADAVLVIIKDDGIGFDAEEGADPGRPGKRMGLAGMKQRIGAVGGRL